MANKDNLSFKKLQIFKNIISPLSWQRIHFHKTQVSRTTLQNDAAAVWLWRHQVQFQCWQLLTCSGTLAFLTPAHLGRWRENCFREMEFHSLPLGHCQFWAALGTSLTPSWDEIGPAAALPMSCTLLTPVMLPPSLRPPGYLWICFSSRASKSC